MKEATKRYFIILGDERVGKTFFVDRLNGKKVEQDHSYQKSIGCPIAIVKNEFTKDEEWEIHDYPGDMELDEKFDSSFKEKPIHILNVLIFYDIND